MAEEQNSDNLPELTDKQQLFVDYYFIYGCNATKAAKAAGYSERTARKIGSENLTKLDIAAHIRARMSKVAMQADEVLMHLAEIGRSDFDDVTDDNGNLDLKKARESGTSRLIKRVKTRAITTENSDIVESEIEMHDRLKALELIGKTHRLFVERQEITGADGGPIPIIITGMDVNEL